MLSSTSATDLITRVAAKTTVVTRHQRQSAAQALPEYPHLGGTGNEEPYKNPAFIEQNTDRGSPAPLPTTRAPDLAPPLDYSLSAVDQFDHFSRIKAVLTYSDRHGKWIGIKHFINLYFSTVFHSFFGEQVEMNVIHVEKQKKMGAHFSRRGKRAYRVIIMLNYRLWDKILLSACALPDIYFQRPDRSYLEKAASLTMPPGRLYLGPQGEQQTALSDNAGSSSADNIQADPDEPATATNKWYEVSVAALCLVHRLEMIMFNDLRYNHASHVVTIGTFFANNNEVSHPFVIDKLYD